ncbi:MAG: hypothetical protein LiPW41_530 [Parcubacteria group bacterium LiPW_41]|nr:MAG: hypothetical protein LiPW41_530 [Parcubacteria group bacterium LiPW_41]
MAKVLDVILLDGESSGIKIIELKNWAGKAFIIPRGSLRGLKDRKEINDPGVYFLFRKEADEKRVYIGQSEGFYKRIKDHDLTKEEDVWDTAFVFTGALDSTYINFLESVSVSLVKKSGFYETDNKVKPGEKSLSESQKIVVQEYFENIKLIMSVFGFNIFQEKPKAQDSEIYYFMTKGAEATGTLLNSGEFVVFKGSTAMIEEIKSFEGSGPALRRRLVDQKVLEKVNDNIYVFSKDYIFTSPSAAGDTVAGGSKNGWIVWKDKDKKTLDENKRK